MCGIVGAVGLNNPTEYVQKGLKMLDYRGYDFAGLAYFDNGIKIIKDVGSVEHLMSIVPSNIISNLMIGHTRWATHGAPDIRNTHPHISFNKHICLVHNGVIENYKEIKDFLFEEGYRFYGETDSEVVANLLEYYYLQNKSITESVKKVMSMIVGSYAIVGFTDDNKESLLVFKNASPQVIGIGDGFNLVASDASPLVKYTNRFIELDDFDQAIIEHHDINVFDKDGNRVKRKIITKDIELISHDLKEYPHYMLN